MRAEDLLAGVDTHGYFLAVQCGTRAYVYPAKGSDGKGSTTCTGATAEPEYGQILWLDGPGEQQMLASNPVVLGPYIRAWHDYGAYVGDRNEGNAVPQGTDAMTSELEQSTVWEQVVSSIRSDPHPIDTTVANGHYHLNPAVPADFFLHLHVLATTCSTTGC